MSMRILGVAMLLGGLSQISFGASIFVVGSVNFDSGTALDTVTGTSISFSPPCDTTASAASISVLGGCAQGEVSSLGSGTLGTPNGPLESTGPNGEVPAGSGVFIAGYTTSTTFPVDPALEFVNNAQNAIGVVVEATSIGPGAQTNCSTSSVPNGAPCSIWAGDPITLEEGGNGVVTATLDITGLAWDPTMPSDVSTFIGAITTQITSLPGITGTPTPLQIQEYFGCTSSADTLETSCTNLTASFTTASSAEFTATFTPVTTTPEPGTSSMMMIGTGLVGLAMILRRRRSAR